MGSLAFNPNYTQQGSRPLPISFGYTLASGDPMIPMITPAGTQLSWIALGDGEHDGIEMAVVVQGDMLRSLTGGFAGPLNSSIESALHPGSGWNTHLGAWTPIGLETIPFSLGPDQGYDFYFGNVPTLTPPQAFSNIFHIVASVTTADAFHLFKWTQAGALAFFGVIRGTRCRTFDANGNVTGYGFTVNPTWHMVEVLLRYKIKREQPQNAGLTPAERACFNWPAIVAHAAYNDAQITQPATVNTQGISIPALTRNRYTGNYVFAAKATLGSMLETMLRCCQSYLDDANGQIGFYHFAAADSVCTVTGNDVVPGSFKIQKKDLSDAANVYVPQFRDMGIPALLKVTAVGMNGSGFNYPVSNPNLGGGWGPGIWGAWFTTGEFTAPSTFSGGVNPFAGSSFIHYGDSNEPDLNGDYLTMPQGTAVPSTPLIFTWVPEAVATAHPSGVAATGGYIGTQTSRFAPRTPNTVQHTRHQVATAAVAPGIFPLANVKPVLYDLGNMSYDQANRLMQYQCNFQLGNDVDGWTAPLEGSLKITPVDAVDADGVMFAQLRPWQRFTLDNTASFEFAGDYLVDGTNGGIQVVPPSKSEPLGAVVINFRSYNPNAFTDTSYAPDSSLLTISTATLPYANSTLQAPSPHWVIELNNASTTNSDGTFKIVLSTLVMQVLGRVGFTTYNDVEWGRVAVGVNQVLVAKEASPGVIASTEVLTGTYEEVAAGVLWPNFIVLSGNFDTNLI